MNSNNVCAIPNCIDPTCAPGATPQALSLIHI